MKNILKKILFVYWIYLSISWFTYLISLTTLRDVKLKYGPNKGKAKCKKEWVWISSIKNFKKAFRIIVKDMES